MRRFLSCHPVGAHESLALGEGGREGRGGGREEGGRENGKGERKEGGRKIVAVV